MPRPTSTQVSLSSGTKVDNAPNHDTYEVYDTRDAQEAAIHALHALVCGRLSQATFTFSRRHSFDELTDKSLNDDVTLTTTCWCRNTTPLLRCYVFVGLLVRLVVY
jgi:hypothetical protein